MRLRLAGIASLALAMLGCGPIQSTSLIMDADAQLEAARTADAPKYAPYEYTLADAYLHKAREEAGYAEYQDAIDYGQKAEDLANRARAIAVSKQAEAASQSTRTTPASEKEEPAPAPKRSEPE